MFSAGISGIARIRIGNADICPCCKYSTNYQIGKIKQKNHLIARFRTHIILSTLKRLT